MLNVSGRSVNHATTVLEQGSKELVEAVERGEVAVSRAATVAKSLPKSEQLTVATEKPPRKKKTAFEMLKQWWEKADSTSRTRFRKWIEE